MKSFLCLVLVISFSGCASFAKNGKDLEYSASRFNDHLRWKRFSSAAAYLLPTDKPAFLERYLMFEDELSVEGIEIRDVSWLPNGKTPTALVTVTAESYLLPSTVLEKRVITQRWEYLRNNWRVVERSRELVPEVLEDDPTELAQPDIVERWSAKEDLDLNSP